MFPGSTPTSKVGKPHEYFDLTGTGGCPSRDPITAYGNDFGQGLQRVEQLGDRVSHLSRERALLFLEFSR